jgi:hypothetical protein
MSDAPFKDEEHAFRFYARAISQAGVSAVDPMAMRGVEYDEVCGNCKSTRWVKQDGAWRCAGFKCGRARPWKVIGVPRGFFQENARRNSGNHSVERSADLGVVFSVLKDEEMRAWWSYIAIHSYRGAAHFCRKQWPSFGWNYRRVMELADTARGLSRPRLIRRGLIEP